MAAQPNIGGALCESSVIPFLKTRRKVWLTPTGRVPCSNAGNIERKTWTQSEFCSWQNSVRKQQPLKCIYSVAAQEMAKDRARCCWPPVSDVAAVTKPRRESRWNLLGCPKLPNGSQLLVGRSSPYCEDIWRRYCYLTSFFPIVDTCLSCKDTARQSYMMVPLWRIFGHFLRPVFQRGTCGTFQTCIINSH